MGDDGLPGAGMVVAMLIGMLLTAALCARAVLRLLSGVLVAWHVLVRG